MIRKRMTVFILLLAALTGNAQEYYLQSDFTSFVGELNSGEGVLSDEAKGQLNGTDVIHPSIRDDLIDGDYFHIMGDLRDERADSFANNGRPSHDECLYRTAETGCDQLQCPPINGDTVEDYLIAWLYCDYDAYHLRDEDEWLDFSEVMELGGDPGSDPVTTMPAEGAAMLELARDLDEQMRLGNWNMIAFFSMKFYQHMPHSEQWSYGDKALKEDKQMMQAVLMRQETNHQLLELMESEISFMAEDVLSGEKRKMR